MGFNKALYNIGEGKIQHKGLILKIKLVTQEKVKIISSKLEIPIETKVCIVDRSKGFEKWEQERALLIELRDNEDNLVAFHKVAREFYKKKKKEKFVLTKQTGFQSKVIVGYIFDLIFDDKKAIALSYEEYEQARKKMED